MKKQILYSSKLKVIILSLFIIFLFFEMFLNLFAHFAARDRAVLSEKELPEITCFGDSFVYGIGVDVGDDYPSVMNNILTDYKVINHGEPSINSSIVLSKIRKEISKKELPEIITVQIGLNNYWNKEKIETKGMRKQKLSFKNLIFKVKTFRFFYIAYNSIFKGLSERFKPESVRYIKEHPANFAKKGIKNTFHRLYKEKMDFVKYNDFISAIRDSDSLSENEHRLFERWIKSLKKGDDIIPIGSNPSAFSLILCIDNRIRNKRLKEALELSFKRDDDIAFYLYRGFIYFLLKENDLAQEWFEFALKTDDKDVFSQFYYGMFLLNMSNKKKIKEFEERYSMDKELFKNYILFRESQKNVNDSERKNIVLPPFAGLDIYLNFYRLNHIMLYRKKIQKTDIKVLKAFLYNLFLEAEIYTIQKYYTLGNPWFFSQKYQDFIKKVEHDILTYPDLWIVDKELKEYVFCFLTKKLRKKNLYDFEEKLDLYRFLFREFPEKHNLSENLLSLFFSLDKDKDFVKMEKIVEILKENTGSEISRKDYFEADCFMLFSKINNGKLSLCEELEKISEDAIKLFDTELFYRYRSEALKTIVMTRKDFDVDEVISFHEKAIERFGSFDFYSNLGIIYRYLFIDDGDTAFLKESVRNLIKAIDIKYDEGLLNLIVLNLGFEGKEEEIKKILKKFPQAGDKYDVKTILSLSKGSSMTPRLYEPKEEKFRTDIYEYDKSLLADLREIKSLCDRKNIKVVFLNYLQARIPEMMILKKEQSDTLFFNIYELFGKENERLGYTIKEIFLSDGHLTPLGNRYVAKRLVNFMTENGLLTSTNKVKDL